MRDVYYIWNEGWQDLSHKNCELGKGKFVYRVYSQRGILNCLTRWVMRMKTWIQTIQVLGKKMYVMKKMNKMLREDNRHH